MRVPPIDTIEGAYWYIIGFVVGVALLCGLYLLATSAGLVPDFAEVLVL